MVVNVDSEGHGYVLHHVAALINSAARPPIMKDGALVGPEMIDGMTDASATRRPRRPWTRSSTVHHGISIRADLCGTHRVTETCCCSPREVDQVLAAGGFGSWDDLRFSNAVECSLAAKLAGRFDRPHDGGEIAVGAQMIAFNDGRFAPVRAGEPHTGRDWSAE